MSAVRFLKPWSLYNPGEVAGFDDETTAVLLKNGTAVPFEDEEAESAKPARKGKKAAAETVEPSGESGDGAGQDAPEAA